MFLMFISSGCIDYVFVVLPLYYALVMRSVNYNFHNQQLTTRYPLGTFIDMMTHFETSTKTVS